MDTRKHFEVALKHVLKWEGFISDDPQDAGKLTIWGISYRSHKDAVSEMKRLIEAGDKDKAFKIAEDIYWNVYWLKAKCDNMHYPLNICVFDTAVNMGRSMAMKILEHCRRKDFTPPHIICWKDYLLSRLYTYSKFKQAKLYFRGWSNRVLDLYKMIEKGD